VLTARTTVVLRHNVTMPGDADLALREWAAILGRPGEKLSALAFAERHASAGAASPRLATTFDWVAMSWTDLPLDDAAELIRRSGFAQEVFIEGASQPGMMAALTGRVGTAATMALGYSRPVLVALAHNYVIETEAVLAPEVATGRVGLVVRALLDPYRTGRDSPLARKLRGAKKTSLSLSHDLHIFKAKFFPRMVRALINIHGRDATVIDPYCGSGTALLEAALLGQDAIGIDIDPICALISRAKVAPFVGHRAEVETALDRLRIALSASESADRFVFPDELERKIIRRDRIDATAYLSEIKCDAAALARSLSAVATEGVAGDLLRVLASDAATKKVRYRFVGVGNGRYTIEILKQPLLSRLREKIDRTHQLLGVFAELESELRIRLGRVTVAHADARDGTTWPSLPARGFVVTSPPYLPASSGREHYAASRALAFAILGYDAGQDGYFDGRPDGGDTSEFDPEFDPEFDRDGEVERLMTYLLSDRDDAADPQRDAMRFHRKAVPTAHYLRDIGRFGSSLADACRSARLVLVVADQHVFYSHRRGVVEHVVDCATLYDEVLKGARFELRDEMELQLLKSAASRAKPRAKDDYHETVLMFEPGQVARSADPGSPIPHPAENDADRDPLLAA
jgi:hypothetical protein